MNPLIEKSDLAVLKGRYVYLVFLKEGHREVENNQRPGHPLPARAGTGHVPEDIIGKIGDPNEHELEEGHVGPDDQKREQEAAQVAHRLRRDN